MKIGRSLGLGMLFVLLLFGTAAAGYYFMDSGGWTGASKTMEQSQLSPSVSFTGTLAAVNEDTQKIMVDTVVPGLMGPEENLIPFAIDNDTTLTICFKSSNTCESAVAGQEGLETLNSFSQVYADAGVNVRNNVIVVGDPDNSSRTVHVQVEYEI